MFVSEHVLACCWRVEVYAACRDARHKLCTVLQNARSSSGILILAQVFERNVLWVSMERRELGDPERGYVVRPAETLRICKHSLALVAFHVRSWVYESVSG